jgi:hypothetical protein
MDFKQHENYLKPMRIGRIKMHYFLTDQHVITRPKQGRLERVLPCKIITVRVLRVTTPR